MLPPLDSWPCYSQPGQLAELRNRALGQRFGGWFCLSQGLDTGVTYPGTWLHSHLPYYHGVLRFMKVSVWAPLPFMVHGGRLTVCSVWWQEGGEGWGRGELTRKDLEWTLTAPSLPSALCPQRLAAQTQPNPIFLSHSAAPHTVQDPYSNTPIGLLGHTCPQGPVSLPSQPVPLTPQLFPTLTSLFYPQLNCHPCRNLPSESLRALTMAQGFPSGSGRQCEAHASLPTGFLCEHQKGRDVCLSSPAVSSGPKPLQHGWGVRGSVVVSLSQPLQCDFEPFTSLGLAFLHLVLTTQLWGIGQIMAIETGRSDPAHLQA